MCVNSSSISMLLNGSPTNDLKVGKGFRHGDPFFPFIFSIVVEGLGWMMGTTVSSKYL